MGDSPTRPEHLKWTIHGSRSIYESAWLELRMVDVELNSGRRFEHEVIHVPSDAVGTLVVVDDRLLMIWRHRMIPDTWGWEIPAGLIDEGESVAVAAQREVLEETGWRCGPTVACFAWHPSSGMSDQRFHLERATSATHVDEPADIDEAVEVAWILLEDLRPMIEQGHIVDGLTMTAVWSLLAG